MDLWSLGKEPISPEQPTGTDVRYEPEFEALQAEIDKLSNPSAAGGTDWQKVNQLAGEILAGKSKDLLAASYLAVAQIQTRQIEGLAVGLRVYRDLLEHYWENLYPPKKRMRGRVAAVEWWVEKSDAALQPLRVEPLPPEKIEACRKDLQEIDRLLQEHLDTAPLTRPLERFIDAIPIAAEEGRAAPAPETQAAPGPPPSAPTPATAPAPAKSPPAAPEKVPAPAAPERISSETEAERALRAALQTLRRVADHYQSQDPCDPRSYRWRRVAGWTLIQTRPPATDGRTQIPPPLNAVLVQDELRGLRERGNWAALLQAAEEKFQGAVLWLDLSRFAAEALAGLGDRFQDAGAALNQETAHLLYRLFGVEKLLFADGTPFGDPETQRWLNGIRLGQSIAPPEPSVPSGSEADTRLTEMIRTAQDLAKGRQVREAVTLLQQALRGSYSRREQMLWRLGLSQILMSVREPNLALPHLESVLEDIDRYRLEEWDPDFALKGLKMVWHGYSTSSVESIKGRAADVLNRIAKLDPAEALPLSKR